MPEIRVTQTEPKPVFKKHKSSKILSNFCNWNNYKRLNQSVREHSADQSMYYKL